MYTSDATYPLFAVEEVLSSLKTNLTASPSYCFTGIIFTGRKYCLREKRYSSLQKNIYFSGKQFKKRFWSAGKIENNIYTGDKRFSHKKPESIEERKTFRNQFRPKNILKPSYPRTYWDKHDVCWLSHTGTNYSPVRPKRLLNPV